MSGTDSPGGAPEHPDGPGQPGQYPPPSQPYGQPGQPPQPYGSPGQSGQPPQPGQGYGTPPPNPYTTPQRPPGEQPAGQPGGWSYGQPPAGPPPGGPQNSSGNNKVLWIILAVVAGFVVLVIVAVIALLALRGGGDSVAKTGTQSEVVKSYLTAVADGDAEKALKLAAVQPLTKDFLTDEMLADSAKTGKITEIQVGEVANEYTSTVPVKFKLGDQVVTQDFSVTKSGEDWRMQSAGSELDFTSLRKNTLPLAINGQRLEVDKVTLFPGVYALSTGSKYITYGETGQLTVQGNRDYLRTTDLSPELTPEGEKDYTAAVRASTQACLVKKELAPANCPNQVGNSATFKLDKSSIKWAMRDGTNPFADLSPRLDYESPNVVTSRPSIRFEVTATCSSSSGRCSQNTYSYGQAMVDMTKEPLAVKWVK